MTGIINEKMTEADVLVAFAGLAVPLVVMALAFSYVQTFSSF